MHSTYTGEKIPKMQIVPTLYGHYNIALLKCEDVESDVTFYSNCNYYIDRHGNATLSEINTQGDLTLESNRKGFAYEVWDLIESRGYHVGIKSLWFTHQGVEYCFDGEEFIG